MRLQTLIAIIALIALGCFLALVALDWYEMKPQPAQPAGTAKAPSPDKRNKAKTRGKRAPRLRGLLVAAERAQKFTKWEEAAKQYQKAQNTLSLAGKDADAVRRKLDAVKNVILAEKLAAEEKWAQAILYYQAALDEIENRSYVERKITRTGIRKNIAEHKTKAEQLAQQGKWDGAQAELKEAFRIARAAGMSADIQADMRRLKKVSQGLGNRVRQMNRAIDACVSSDNLYGVLALCYCFAKDPDYVAERQSIESKNRQAADTIAARPKDFPSPVALSDTEIVTVHRPGGNTSEGTLLQAEGSRLVLSVLEGPRWVPKTFMKTPGVKIEKKIVPAKVLNESRARHLLTEAVQSLAKKDRMAALATIGCLIYYFPKSEIVTDQAKQEWTIGGVSPSVAATYGRTLEDMIGRVAEELGDMCTACSGTGLRKCPSCNGTGMRDVKCIMCRGTGTVPCFRCGGTAKVLINGRMVKCPACKGTGRATCAPCRGTGRLQQACTACDVNHMVKCPVCGGTGQGERRVEDMVDGPRALVKADTPQERKKRMEWVFDICTSRQDDYALFAAASHYEKLENYKDYADLIAARKKEARLGVKEHRESAKEEAAEKYDVITTKNNERLVGKITDETESTVTLVVQQGKETAKRFIARKSILKLEKDAFGEDDSAYAGTLLANAAVLLRDKQPEKDRQALACVGRILLEHPTSEAATNEEVQKRIISNASPETALTVGQTLRPLLSAAVRRMESICFDCLGKGKFPCKTCKGTGTCVVPCKWCHGAKRIFCRYCGGSGREGDSAKTEKPCHKCNGTGFTRCPHCKGKGTEVVRCKECKGAGETTCKTCGGKGRIDIPPANP
ncbi:MAG: hypothetical protein GXP25_02615 [Planctomycetes bacterium]|nr:hypothetical protein [Planctomycetota bacterium]